MLHFNDQTLPCPEGLTLAVLLTEQRVNGERVATAVNGEFIPCAHRATTPLQPGDTVLTFQAIVGG